MNSTLLIDEDDCLFLCHSLALITYNITLDCLQDVDYLLETVETSKPSLIFIDYYLPKRDGLDLLRQIKNHLYYKNIPIMM